MPSLQYRVVILDKEDEDTVDDYFHKLADIFDQVVAMSAFAFDTPTTFFDIELNP